MSHTSVCGLFNKDNAPGVVWFLGIRWQLSCGFYRAEGMPSTIMSEMLVSLNSGSAFTQEGYEAHCAHGRRPPPHSKFDS
jgi:hypothetical protein